MVQRKLINEKITLRMIFGRVKRVRQHLLSELQLRLLVEVLVETEQRTAILEVVAGELDLR